MAKRRPDSEPSLWDLPEDTTTTASAPTGSGSSGGGASVALHEAAQSRY